MSLVEDPPVEWLEAVLALEESLAVSAHMTQQHEPTGELLVADRALKNQEQSWTQDLRFRKLNFGLFQKITGGTLQKFWKE